MPRESDAPQKPGNKLVEALKEDGHLIALSGAALLAAVTGQFWLVGLGAAIAETLYVIFVPDSAWYRTRLDRRYDAEVARVRERLKRQLLHGLDEPDRARFGRLERLQRDLAEQYKDPSLSWSQDVLRRVQYLVDHFLTFADEAVKRERYLREQWRDVQGVATVRRESTARRRGDRDEAVVGTQTIIEGLTRYYNHEIEELEERLRASRETIERKSVTRHIDILTKRRESALRKCRDVQNLRHQMEIVEDLLGLLNDQLRDQSPQQIIAEIDDVIRTSDTIKETLDEMAPLEEQIDRLQQGL